MHFLPKKYTPTKEEKEAIELGLKSAATEPLLTPAQVRARIRSFVKKNSKLVSA